MNRPGPSRADWAFGWLAVARAAGLILLAGALMVRGLTAPGYMPGRNDLSGQLTIAMCSGSGEHLTLSLHRSSEQTEQHGQKKDCPFASIGAPVSAAGPILASTLSVHPVRTPPPARTQVHVMQTRIAGAPPTGPPALA